MPDEHTVTRDSENILDELGFLDSRRRLRLRALRGAVRNEVADISLALRHDEADADRIRQFEEDVELVLKGIGQATTATEREIAALEAPADPITALGDRERARAIESLPLVAEDLGRLTNGGHRQTVTRITAERDRAMAAAWTRELQKRATSTMAEGESPERRRLYGELLTQLERVAPRHSSNQRAQLVDARTQLKRLNEARKFTLERTRWRDRKVSGYLEQGRRWMKLDAQKEQAALRESARNAAPRQS